MKHILKAEEHEQIRNSIRWDLTIYDDEKGEIKEITEFQIIKECSD